MDLPWQCLLQVEIEVHSYLCTSTHPSIKDGVVVNRLHPQNPVPIAKVHVHVSHDYFIVFIATVAV